ncbi:conjugal transfer protein TrbL family protein [Actinoplanes sp. CA-030573]|uniref:conjugal transfer protein TrbL family protein n=1 Tax=Actinoplanes sp. CA-030573 TaxID=3239898 RepID=UPI003D8B6AAA
MPGWLLLHAVIGWLASAVLDIVELLWKLLEGTAFTSPDVTVLPQVAVITARSQGIVNACFVLAVLAAGITVMTHGSVHNRYTVSELLPRLVIGWLGATFAVPLCQWLIRAANALTTAFTGDSITATGSLGQVRAITVQALSDPSSALLATVVGVFIAVLTGMLILLWLVRIGLLVLLVGISPLALACHATPYTEACARLWWRALLGTLATAVLQALALHTALSVFLAPDANLAALGIPYDPTGTINLLLVLCLLWVVVKIPALMRRYVTRGSAGRNPAGMIIRMLLVQQLPHRLPLPRRRTGAGRSLAAAGPRYPFDGGSGGVRAPRPWPTGPAGPGSRRLPPPGQAGTAGPARRPVPPSPPQQPAAGAGPDTGWRSPTGGPQPTPPRPSTPGGVTPATATPHLRPPVPPTRGPGPRPGRPG